MVTTDVITGAIKLTGLPERACFESFDAFIKALPDYLSVEVPTNISNVIVSNIQPQDTQRNAVWFRMSNGGTFIGIYLYSNGTWTQFFPVPGQLTRVYGDSREPPAGFIIATDSIALTSAQKAFIQNTWYQDSSGLFYSIFDVVPAPT